MMLSCLTHHMMVIWAVIVIQSGQGEDAAYSTRCFERRFYEWWADYQASILHHLVN